MTRRFLSPGRLAAFTIIELLTVIAIILILAGLLLNIAGNAQYKSSMSRAQGEIQAISTALESYKVDNGIYPRDTATTDMLNAQTSTDPKSTTSPTYKAASQYLYQQLSGYLSTTTTSSQASALGKSYFPFKPNQLYVYTSDTQATIASGPSNYIVDPFGYSYGYSTAAAAAADAAQTSGKPVDTTMGYNPTFDLWCTGGYSPSGGKSYTSKSITVPQSVWAKNW